jgi:mevalonate kinase
MARGVGFGKLLLFGEHSAVYGHPALGIALPWTVTVDIRSAGPPSGPGHLAGVVPDHADDFHALLADAGLNSDAHVHVVSTVPPQGGLGSSAAVCAAVAEAVIASRGDPADAASVWHLANRLERRFHGTPSGIDTGLAVLGTLTRFEPAPPSLPRFRPLPGGPLFLVFGVVPRTGNTKGLVGGLRERMERGNKGVAATLTRLGAIADDAAALCARPAPQALSLGRLADEAQAELASLGLSVPALDGALETARHFGALGGKLSGAGGGGAFYAVAPDAEVASAVRDGIVAQVAAGALRVSVLEAVAVEAGRTRLLPR